MNERVKDTEMSTADVAAAKENRQEQPRPSMGTKEFASSMTPATSPQTTGDTRPMALLSMDDAEGFRSRWDAIQTGFVDEPRRAVEQADALVVELMKRLAEIFSHERSQLEEKWGQDRDVSTEDLRVALQRYRSFFGRLLSV
jgi:hypothetical protein